MTEVDESVKTAAKQRVRRRRYIIMALLLFCEAGAAYSAK
jgi:hypothetical protein